MPPDRRRPRRACSVAKAFVPKVCAACKQASRRIEDVYRCREVLRHIAPNYDTPEAESFFRESAKSDDATRCQPLVAKRSQTDHEGRGIHNESRQANKRGRRSRQQPASSQPCQQPELQEGSSDELLKFEAVCSFDARDRSISRRVMDLRRNGVPFVLRNVAVRESLGFVSRWIDGAGRLDEARMVAEIGDARAPILRCDADYSDAMPIRESMRVADYVCNVWLRNEDESLYLHQWQFPLAPARIAGKLLAASPLGELPGFGDDLLRHWLECCGGRSALQYLFMGCAGTYSRLHVDPGGLDLLVAPIVGLKEVTLVHRDDADLVRGALGSSSESEQPASIGLDRLLAAPSPPSLRDEPLLSIVRCWRHVVEPGQLLVVPEGTLHAVRNPSPCLSYHRFHLDKSNFAGFWRALVAGDAPGIRPAEILWNAAHGVMKHLDDIVDAKYYGSKRGFTVEASPDTQAEVAAVDTLRALGNLVAAVDQEFHNATAVANNDRDRGSDFYWQGLLFDIRNALDHWRVGHNQSVSAPGLPRKKSSRARSCAPDPCDEVRARGEQFMVADSQSQRHLKGWEDLAAGDLVAVGFHRKRLRAKVLLTEHNARMARVHYTTYGDKYDELVPIDECIAPARPKRADLSKLFVPCVGARCRVPWGSKRELYNARITHLYTGPAFKLRYSSIGADWDQWVCPHQVQRKLK